MQAIVATSATIEATTDGRPVATKRTTATNAKGAPVRAAVSPMGRGASNATSTVTHRSHRSTSATTRGVASHGRSASAATEPAVTGNETQARRSNSKFTSFVRAGFVVGAMRVHILRT